MPEPVRQLRDLTRRRIQLSQGASREQNRVQKLLEQANVNIASVLSDVFGVSGQRMLVALLAGEATPEEIAQLALETAQRKIPQLIDGLNGPVSSSGTVNRRPQISAFRMLYTDRAAKELS